LDLLVLAAMLAAGTGCALSHRGHPGDSASSETDLAVTDRVETDAADAFIADASDDATDADDVVSDDVVLADGADAVDANDVTEDVPMADVPVEIAADVIADGAMPVDATDVVDVPADVPVDAPPPPPASILFRHSTDVPRFGDYVVRWGHTDTTLSAWETGHCPAGIITLAIPDNWSQCDLDLPLAPGDVLDAYPVYPGGAEVCGSGGPCPSVFNERFTIRQGARDYLGTAGAVSFQRETVAGHVYQFVRVYL